MSIGLVAQGTPQTDFDGFLDRHASRASPIEMWTESLDDEVMTLHIAMHSADASIEAADKLELVVHALWTELGVTVVDLGGAPELDEDSLQDLLGAIRSAEV